MINMDQQILDKWVGVRMTSEMYSKLVEISDKEDISIPKLIRKAMERVIIVFK